MKKRSFIALGLLISAQLAVPIQMIRDREHTLRNGELFRFLTRPVDPADPFQGRYVRLGFQDDYILYSKMTQTGLHRNERIYAIIEVDKEGFAHFVSWSKEEPISSHFLKVRYLGPQWEWDQKTGKSVTKGMLLDIPFDRFYMEEAKAPRAEELMRDAMRDARCWVNVRILNGKAVIEDLLAEGQSLRDLAEKKE